MRNGTRRQIDVEARAEADHADALAGGERLSLFGPAHDAPRDQAGDLYYADTAFVGCDQEGVAFVVLARLVEIGIEEFSRRVGDALDPAGHRRAVHVAVEHAHEDG